MIFAATIPFLNELVALFVVSVLIAYVSFRLKLVPIAGFLIAGVVIGPNALGLVKNQELVDILAEIGVVLLLFMIGMELGLKKILRSGRTIFLGGGLQVVSSILIVTLTLLAFGVSWRVGIYTGCLVALSSTAIVLGLLSERRETDTPTGRLSLAILIFQDLAIVGMVLIVPVLGVDGGSFTEILLAFGEAVALIAAVLFLARKVVPWILERVALTRRPELFLLTIVAICFGTAAASSLVGISLALGAFLGGLVVSESQYSTQAISEILPLKTIFNAVFFVSVGMLLDVHFLSQNLLLVLAAAGIVLLIKAVTTFGSVLVLGYPSRIAAAVGLGLAQIGEFSFVLERSGRMAGLTPAGLGEAGAQTFLAATVLLMLLTPFQMQLGTWMGARLSLLRIGSLKRMSSQQLKGVQTSEIEIEAQKTHREDHVIIIGYGPSGRRLVQVLQDRGIPFVVIEIDPFRMREMQAAGIPVIYGDASRAHVLETAEIATAKLCVIVMNDPGVVPRLLHQARFLNPTLQIIVRTRHLESMEGLQKLGADIVVPEEVETSVRIFSHVLGAYMISPEEVDRQIQIIREQDYGIMRGSIQEAHLMVLQGLDEDGMHTRVVAVRSGAHADGKTLEQLALRRRYGITVLALRRSGKTIASPAGNFTVMDGDRLVLVGTADHFAESASIFRFQPDILASESSATQPQKNS
jgi:monovalent cation:H+ antiporter-2, CPA2 family